ncbi:glycoside hydrolase family 97 N-terminal domain-containing protein [Chitinophaga pinensis]|uniref:Glycosyl-hydrolase 97 N-terminal domain-containing protein n=1 Tax=Chitinophaga pinensis TaxID=79329 RepID=A0A5C6LWM7_9BACT|nr:glycoside hydrolase family 97 N-terminal domain-containing protein [Chitinophaga pinensis]TWW01641.1 hypothetical protein FEF09_03500 [Chitinophaga pinensis]
MGRRGKQQFLSHFELLFKDTTLASFSHEQHCGLPLYMSSSSGTKMLFSEADLLDYSNLFFFGTGSNKITSGFPKVILKESLVRDRVTKIEETADYIARTNGNRSFPWRLIMVANEDKELIENNLVYQLASPNILKETDWIKPGKAAWDWWNDNNIYGVDFRSVSITKLINTISTLQPDSVWNTSSSMGMVPVYLGHHPSEGCHQCT